MEIGNLNLKSLYKTPDWNLASLNHACGNDLVSVYRNGKVTFFFADKEKAEELARQYWRKKLVLDIPVNEFLEAQQFIKDVIYKKVELPEVNDMEMQNEPGNSPQR